MNWRNHFRQSILGIGYFHLAMLLVAVRRGPRAAAQYLREIHKCSKTDAGFRLPIVTVDELASEDVAFTVFRPANPHERYAALSVNGISALCNLVATRRPKKILELGTFRGVTCLNLAMNAPQAIVHTVDETHKWGKLIFEGRLEAARIRAHIGDSRSFDFSQIGDGVDLCLIDAGHSYECVRNDTIKVLPLMNDNSILLWDNYGENDLLPSNEYFGISKFLHEISDFGVKVLKGTAIAMLEITPNVRRRLLEELS